VIHQKYCSISFMKDMEDTSPKEENNGLALQPILFSKEQYKELLRAVGAYGLIKQSSVVPSLASGQFGDFLIEQGKKFGFEKISMDEIDWFDEVNDEVFEALFQYTQEEMWRHLAHLLAQRDVRNEIGDKTGLSEGELPSDMFLDAMAVKVQMYLKEFEKNGIKNITVSCKGAHLSPLQISEEQ